MATSRTCTTPEEGWGLYSHFISNLLTVIRSAKDIIDSGEDEANNYKHERTISDTWSKLLGHLYMIMRRMIDNGHEDEADKMKEIVDMIVVLDLTDPEARKKIIEKHNEHNVKAREFAEQLARLQAKHEE